MPSTKHLVLFIGVLLIGGVIGLTWIDGGSPITGDDPTDLSEQTSLTLPRGINPDGILAQALIEEHTAALDEQTYTLTITHTETVDSVTTTQKTSYKKGQTATLMTIRRDGALVSEHYEDYDEQAVYERHHSEDGITLSKQVDQRIAAKNDAALEAIFRSGAFSPTNVETDAGTQLVTLEAARVSRAELFSERFGMTTIETFTGHATVDDQQLIQRVSIDAEGTYDSNDAAVTYEAVISDVNRTGIAQPAWIADAEDQSVASRAELSSDSRIIVVAHDDGPTLPAGTIVDMYIEQDGVFERVRATLETPFEPDTSRLLTLNGETLTISTETPTQQGEELTADSYQIELTPPGASSPVIDFVIRP